MKMKFVRESICPCGFPALSVKVPLGTVFDCLPLTVIARFETAIKCGGCGRVNPCEWIYVRARGKSKAGWLPLEIFEEL